MMFSNVTILTFMVLLGFYVCRMIVYAYAIKKPDPQPLSLPPTLRLSIIIPFRNESSNLPRLIKDIRKFDYPQPLLDIIFIDDHSEDNSYDLVLKGIADLPSCSIYRLQGDYSGKKEALAFGIKLSRGVRILQTDADCRLHPKWPLAHAQAALHYPSAFIAGPVYLDYGKRLWNKIEAVDVLSLGAVTAGSFLSSRPVMCNGANISFEREFYLNAAAKLSGNDSPSGDDMFLLIEAKRSGNPVVFLTGYASHVVTQPTGSIARFFNQRIRWASKAKHYRDWDMVLLALLVFALNLCMLIIAGLTVVGILHWVWMIAGWSIKSVIDFLLVYRWSVHVHQQAVLRYFPLVAIFHYIYIVVSGMMGLVGGFTWKGRKY